MFLLLLLLWPLGLFLLLNLLLLPLQFTAFTLANMITIPRQIYEIAVNPRLRANHALEHATINVLEEHYGPLGLAGLARDDGFLIRGPADPAAIEEAARVGLARLQRGETGLAVHDRCGTSIAAANFLASVLFLVLLLQTGRFTVLNILIAMLFANLTGPVLGRLVQKFFTTSVRVGEMVIDRVEYGSEPLAFFGMRIYRRPTDFFVRTRRLRTFY